MKNLFAGALLAALFLSVIWMALSVPVVEWSWADGFECVRVHRRQRPEAAINSRAYGGARYLRAGVGILIHMKQV